MIEIPQREYFLSIQKLVKEDQIPKELAGILINAISCHGKNPPESFLVGITLFETFKKHFSEGIKIDDAVYDVLVYAPATAEGISFRKCFFVKRLYPNGNFLPLKHFIAL